MHKCIKNNFFSLRWFYFTLVKKCFLVTNFESSLSAESISISDFIWKTTYSFPLRLFLHSLNNICLLWEIGVTTQIHRLLISFWDVKTMFQIITVSGNVLLIVRQNRNQKISMWNSKFQILSFRIWETCTGINQRVGK